ncbi:transport and Golgi organization protein 2 [Venturia canescens]|uniref:transport and Golgi organization protein 2 n=1 Tax=Venturia canescens TaxID=32260 RepID=UPI001C9C8577|nr:transport and Golgi organization protein 2 [Venturia canescens]
MCILFVYRNPKAVERSYRLIVASNRDEVDTRPAKPAHYWDKNPDCLGGVDSEPGKEGGTWFALSTKGRAGVLLNLPGYMRVADDAGKGRGYLVVDYLTSDDSPINYLNKLHNVNQTSQPYNPYNLILLDLHDASIEYLSSSPETSGPQQYSGDIFGVSNSLVEEPYAKVRAGMEEMRRIVRGVTVSDRDTLIENLGKMLKSKKRHLPDPELRKRSPKWHEALSSICVSDERLDYKTRTHTILLVDGSDNVTFHEETKMPDNTWKLQTFETKLKPR